MTYTEPLARALTLALDPPSPFQKAIATDADGTLWGMDVGDALFLEVAAKEAFVGEGLVRLKAHGRALLGSSCADWSGGAIARELFAGYERGDIGVRVMCDLEAETVGDREVREFDALLDGVAEAAAASVRADVRRFIQTAHARGVNIHVVSGSLGVLVERALRRAEIPYDRVTGAVLAQDEQYVRAEMIRTSPLFEGKTAALEEGGFWPAAVGMGDGGWDHTFLRQCALAILVHPKQALVDAMADVPSALRIG